MSTEPEFATNPEQPHVHPAGGGHGEAHAPVISLTPSAHPTPSMSSTVRVHDVPLEHFMSLAEADDKSDRVIPEKCIEAITAGGQTIFKIELVDSWSSMPCAVGVNFHAVTGSLILVSGNTNVNAIIAPGSRGMRDPIVLSHSNDKHLGEWARFLGQYTVNNLNYLCDAVTELDGSQNLVSIPVFHPAIGTLDAYDQYRVDIRPSGDKVGKVYVPKAHFDFACAEIKRNASVGLNASAEGGLKYSLVPIDSSSWMMHRCEMMKRVKAIADNLKEDIENTHGGEEQRGDVSPDEIMQRDTAIAEHQKELTRAIVFDHTPRSVGMTLRFSTIQMGADPAQAPVTGA